MEEYKELWKNYTNFSGRTTVRGYWMAILFNIIVSIVIAVVATLIKMPFISFIYALAIFIPSLAIEIRRLHDTNRSGWWIFITLIPVVGFIILLIFLCQGSVDEENKYNA